MCPHPRPPLQDSILPEKLLTSVAPALGTGDVLPTDPVSSPRGRAADLGLNPLLSHCQRSPEPQFPPPENGLALIAHGVAIESKGEKGL